MRNIEEIVIEMAILHILDNKKPNFVTSDHLLKLNDDIYEFLEKHILKSLHDDKTRVANFKGRHNVIKQGCQEVFNDDNSEQFVEISKEVAEKLFNIMSSNRVISPSDLIVITFYSDQNKYIAVLKLDYNEVYKHDYTEEDGEIKTELILDDKTSLPNLNQKLQKCAFIQPSTDDHEYDMILLDRQTSSKSPDEHIAKFFINNFLEADLVKDDKYKTGVFISTTTNFLRKNVESSQKKKEVIDYMNNSLKNRSEININEFSSDAFEDEQLREEYKGALLEKKLGDYEFKPDKETLKKKLKSKRIKTEEGVEIKLDETVYDDEEYFKILDKEDYDDEDHYKIDKEGGSDIIIIRTDNIDYYE